MKILHFADLHLDHSFNDIGLPHALGQARRDGLIEILKKIFEHIKLREVDAVTIAGDLFEQATVMPSTLKLLSDLFEQIAPVPVLIVPGESDAYNTDSLYAFWAFPSNVHVFTGKAFSPYAVTPQLTIWGAPYQSVPLHNLLESCEITEGQNLLLYHYPEDEPKTLNLEILKKHNISFGLLGGKHQYQIIPEGIVAGSPENIGFDGQSQDFGIGLITIEGDKIQSEFIKTDNWKQGAIEVDVSDCKDTSQIEQQIGKALKNDGGEYHYAIITLTGTLQFPIDPSHLADSIDVPSRFIMRLNQPYDLNVLAKEPTIRGFLAKQFLNHLENSNAVEHPRIFNAFYMATQALDGAKEIKNAIESD